MATPKKPRIIVTKDEVKASDIAHDHVQALVPDGMVLCSMQDKTAAREDQDNDISWNDDIGTIATSLTDDEAATLRKKTGVLDVEDDEMMFALSDDGSPFDDDDTGFGSMAFEDDPEAAAEIDDASPLEVMYGEMTDEEAAAMAALDAQRQPTECDEVDLAEDGTVMALSAAGDPGFVKAAEGAGLAKDKIVPFVLAVLKCAIKEMREGNATDISEAQVEALMARSGLANSGEAAAAMRDYITCGLRIIYATYAWRYSKGTGVRVAVVDTGIAPRHPDLRVYGGVSFVSGVRSWADDQGHGTHVAGTIAAAQNNQGVIGVAPQARLYAVKVLNRQGSGRTSAILDGLNWCYRNRMHVVNLSLGGSASSHSTGQYSRAYEQAGRRLRNRGILAVAAAGNSGRTSRPYVGNPARCPSFMAVASVDCNRRRAASSSFGPQVEISAPGVSVWSTDYRVGYSQKSGTSMACPHVAGVAALVKRRRPTWTGDSIRVHMRRTAADLGTSGRDWLYGYGLVNALRSVR